MVPQTTRKTRRTLILVALMALIILVYGATMRHTNALENELEAIAAAKVMELTEELADRRGGPSVRVASTVVASKSLLLFGSVVGKISIYVERQASDGEAAFIEGFEFFYERTEDGWQQTESGRCASDRCTREGKRLLDALNQK